MLKVLADEHVVGPLVSALKKRGVDIATAIELGLKSRNDTEITVAALQDARVILTNDSDFLNLAAQSAGRNEVFPPIIFWPQQRRTVRELLARIMPLLSQTEYAAVCSRVFFV